MPTINLYSCAAEEIYKFEISFFSQVLSLFQIDFYNINHSVL